LLEVIQQRHLDLARRGTVRDGGFSLIELMVTVSILAIVMAVGVPSFKNFSDGQKVKTAAYELSTAFLVARSEAIKRNAAVTIAPATTDTWISGWTVTTVGGTTLLQQEALSGVTITKAASASDIPSNFVYGSNGRLSSATAAQYLQVNGGSSVKCVKVDLTGIPSTQTAACP